MSSARVWSRLAFAEAPSTAIIVTRATPIIRADAVAAVRRGLRRVLLGHQADRPEAPAVEPAEAGEHRSTEDGAQQGGADEDPEDAATQHVRRLRAQVGEPCRHRADARDEEDAADGEAPAQPALGEGGVVAHRGNR